MKNIIIQVPRRQQKDIKIYCQVKDRNLFFLTKTDFDTVLFVHRQQLDLVLVCQFFLAYVLFRLKFPELAEDPGFIVQLRTQQSTAV